MLSNLRSGAFLSMLFEQKRTLQEQALYAFIGSVLLAVSAQITINLPFVPITGQTLALSILALTLGAKLGTASVILYLLEGAIGFPVFANASAGFTNLFSPSGGYLLGFVPAAYLMGKFADKGCLSSFIKTSSAVTLGTLTIFACGLAQLSFYVPAEQLLQAGFYPFILGGIIKGAIATAIVPAIFNKIKKIK